MIESVIPGLYSGSVHSCLRYNQSNIRFSILLDGVVNCMDNSDEENCDERKCSLNKHVYCPHEKKCARRENSARYV